MALHVQEEEIASVFINNKGRPMWQLQGISRSISLPCRSHPTTHRIEEELNKIKAWQAPVIPTSKTIKNGLAGLEDLYRCVEELLSLPVTQQALSRHQNERWVDDLQDCFISLLDICGNAKDVLSQIKEQAREIRSSLRRRKGNLSIKTSIAKYTRIRKKVKKEAKKLISELKQMEYKIGAPQLLELDHHVSSVYRALREVSAVSFCVFQSLLLFLSKSRRRSLVSKLFHKGAVACEIQQENVNELVTIDATLQGPCRNTSREGDEIQIAQNGLECLEDSIDAKEHKLDCLFRRLIEATASLLNITSL
ncbi:hypothetical protein NMG60_11007773 [Bertholletia excelsa]